MKYGIWAAGLAFAALCGPAFGQVSMAQVKARYSATYNACLAAPSGQSTMGQGFCITAETTLQDAALNAAYQKSMGQLAAPQQATLVTAERAWIAFRDADCAAQGNQGLGTLQGTLQAQCVLNRTIIRTIELDDFPVNLAGPAG